MLDPGRGMSLPSKKTQVVVIGAGISGLSTAYRLSRAGLDVLVLESADRAGGVVMTERSEGFLVDLGPTSMLETSPKIRAFIDEIGLGDQRLYGNEQAQRRYILRGGRLRALPMSPQAFLTTDAFSLRAKLRLLAEPFIKPAPPDREETIAEFVKRRLGQEFLDYAINPFVAGVYAGDPKQLSVRSAVRKVYELELKYGSLIKGQIKGARERRRRGTGEKTKAKLFSFQEGMGHLPRALAEKLGDRVVTGAALESLTPEASGGFSCRYQHHEKLQSLTANAIVFAIPAHAAAPFLEGLQSDIGPQLKSIPYAKVAVVFLGFSKPISCRPLDGFGFLVPEVEQRRILGTIWSSTLFPRRAPQGGAALTTFVGGMRQPELAELPEKALVSLVQEELSDIMSLRSTPDFVRVKKWAQAIPQYEVGHSDKVAQLERLEEAHPGLFVSGNFRAGISAADCVLNSEGVADRVLVHLVSRKSEGRGS